MKHLLFSIIMIIAIAGCSSLPKAELPISDGTPLPRFDVFSSIANEDPNLYEVNVYDCSNKAGKYVEALLNNGIENFDVRASKVLYQANKVSYHAYLVFHVDQKELFADPTTGRYGYSLKEMSMPGFKYLEYDNDWNIVYIYSSKSMRIRIRYDPEWCPRPIRE